MYKSREEYEQLRDFILKVESFFKKVFKNGKNKTSSRKAKSRRKSNDK